MRETTASRRALFPLFAIAAVLIVPTYKSCGSGEMESALEYASHGAFDALWVLPVFVCAAVLSLLTFRAVRRNEMDLGTRRLGQLALGAFGASALTVGGLMTADHLTEWPWLAEAVVGFGLAVALTRSARGLRPWQIWEHQLGAFAVLAAASVPSFFIGGDLLHWQLSHLGVGAYAFLGGQLGLWVILAPAIFRAHRRSAA